MPRIQSLKQLANLKNFSKFFNYKTVTDHVVDSLLKEGQRIIREAYESKNWNNRTYNLYNSYVAAVIADGKVVKSIYLGPEKNPSGEDEEYTGYKRWHTSVEQRLGANDAQRGREEADLFVESYAKQHKSKKITLVVGAAMFYAGILESNGYHVLANVSTNLENIASKGLHLTDFKLGNIFKDFKEGSNAQLVIGSKHIALRNDIDNWTQGNRRKTFDTK
jgi:hypothetical protein